MAGRDLRHGSARHRAGRRGLGRVGPAGGVTPPSGPDRRRETGREEDDAKRAEEHTAPFAGRLAVAATRRLPRDEQRHLLLAAGRAGPRPARPRGAGPRHPRPLRVVDICAATALKHGETHGVWGGLSDDERRQLGTGVESADRTDAHDAASR
ncbi:WhiB family transcriptional regulator [Streptomyces sp. NPDC001792]|uniref:WhiB family transcriptional regulator n=1 Tax=Streptomyces sp. NPDC001792 TaxID=3154524 RepID=UPI0033237A84